MKAVGERFTSISDYEVTSSVNVFGFGHLGICYFFLTSSKTITGSASDYITISTFTKFNVGFPSTVTVGTLYGGSVKFCLFKITALENTFGWQMKNSTAPNWNKTEQYNDVMAFYCSSIVTS